MKTTQILIGLITVGSLAMAGNVTIPNTFSANTTAKASEVNANFTAVKNAVNGNAADITTNKNNIAANKTALDSKVSSVTVGDGLEESSSGGNVKIKRADGYVMITHIDFRLTYEGGATCKFAHGQKYAYFSGSTASNCAAFAPVHLPDYAKIDSLTCLVKKKSGSTASKVHLMKVEMDSSVSGALETTLTWTNNENDPSEQTGVPTTTDLKVDNSQYGFFLQYSPADTDTAGSDKAIYNCKIAYSFE